MLLLIWFNFFNGLLLLPFISRIHARGEVLIDHEVWRVTTSERTWWGEGEAGFGLNTLK